MKHHPQWSNFRQIIRQRNRKRKGKIKGKKYCTSSRSSCPDCGSPRKVLPCRAKLARRERFVWVASRSFRWSTLVRSFMILTKMPLSSVTPTKKSSKRSFKELRFFMALKFLSASESSPDFPGKKTFKRPWTKLDENSWYLWWSKEHIYNGKQREKTEVNTHAWYRKWGRPH